MDARGPARAGAPSFQIDPDSYALVTIPRSLEASARVAIAGLYQPFFVEWTDAGIVLVARAAEWERVAGRFPGSVAQAGFRLISLGLPVEGLPAERDADSSGPQAPPDLPGLLRQLAERGIRARPLRSFYRDHLLVAAADLAAAAAALSAGESTAGESSPGTPTTTG